MSSVGFQSQGWVVPRSTAVKDGAVITSGNTETIVLIRSSQESRTSGWSHSRNRRNRGKVQEHWNKFLLRRISQIFLWQHLCHWAPAPPCPTRHWTLENSWSWEDRGWKCGGVGGVNLCNPTIWKQLRLKTQQRGGDGSRDSTNGNHVKNMFHWGEKNTHSHTGIIIQINPVGNLYGNMAANGELEIKKSVHLSLTLTLMLKVRFYSSFFFALLFMSENSNVCG